MIFVEEKNMRLLRVFSCLWSKNVLKLSWNLIKSWPWNFTLSCWNPWDCVKEINKNWSQSCAEDPSDEVTLTVCSDALQVQW